MVCLYCGKPSYNVLQLFNYNQGTYTVDMAGSSFLELDFVENLSSSGLGRISDVHDLPGYEALGNEDGHTHRVGYPLRGRIIHHTD